MPIPEKSIDERMMLVRELLMYLDNKERIWSYIHPCAATAELIRAIVFNTRANAYGSTWLLQVLKKMPTLWNRLECYYSNK